MFYHVTVGQNRYVIEQDDVLQQFLSQLQSTDIAIVKPMDYIERPTTIWGALPGANPLPPALEPAPSYQTFTVSHLTINNTPT